MSNLQTGDDIPPQDMELVSTFGAVFGKLMGFATSDWINLDISTAQIKVIFILHFMGNHTVNNLAERLRIGAPTASHLVEKLVQAGLAERLATPVDRRVAEVRLTSAGRAIAERLSGARDRAVAHWLGQLSQEDRVHLEVSMRALLTVIESSPRWFDDEWNNEEKSTEQKDQP